MDSTQSGKIIHLVLKDYYKELKLVLNEEVIDQLWREDCIRNSERVDIKSWSDPLKRNEILLNILMTK